MESNFNNNTPPAPVDPAVPAENTEGVPGTDETPVSAAVLRFRSCRWMQPADTTTAEFCTHREVKPYAGTASFDAAAWCPDCVYFKLRRVPKKRSPDDYSY
ncbi:MAG: hypothetical protein HOP16_05945 [Acidobacteria bacterium]|nr:hypothetical protein [Acidobacteriota bacterium]